MKEIILQIHRPELLPDNFPEKLSVIFLSFCPDHQVGSFLLTSAEKGAHVNGSCLIDSVSKTEEFLSDSLNKSLPIPSKLDLTNKNLN